MKVSLRAVILVAGLSWSGLATASRAQTPQATSSAALLRSGDLEREIQRLLPTLMSSLAAARREGDALLIRCFDRTVSELHGVRRQVSYHKLRQERASDPAERSRHAKALYYLGERILELAHRSESCFTEGVWVRPGETQVEVVAASSAR